VRSDHSLVKTPQPARLISHSPNGSLALVVAELHAWLNTRSSSVPGLCLSGWDPACPMMTRLQIRWLSFCSGRVPGCVLLDYMRCASAHPLPGCLVAVGAMLVHDERPNKHPIASTTAYTP
jgi:hypothetical protein